MSDAQQNTETVEQWHERLHWELLRERDALAARLAEMTAESAAWRANARDSGEEARKYKARLAEVIAERDSIRTMLLNERTEWMDEAIRRQASVNQNLATLVTDAQEELRKCQQDAIQLQARLAEAEAERDKILRLWLEDADPRECGYAPDSADVCRCPEPRRFYFDGPVRCRACGKPPSDAATVSAAQQDESHE